MAAVGAVRPGITDRTWRRGLSLQTVSYNFWAAIPRLATRRPRARARRRSILPAPTAARGQRAHVGGPGDLYSGLPEQTSAAAEVVDRAGTYSGAGASAPTTDPAGTYSGRGERAHVGGGRARIPVAGATSSAAEMVDPAGSYVWRAPARLWRSRDITSDSGREQRPRWRPGHLYSRTGAKSAAAQIVDPAGSYSLAGAECAYSCAARVLCPDNRREQRDA